MGTEETNLPKLAAPARRALHGAGYTRLEDLTTVTESEVMTLHGMGPNAMQVLRNALRERGLSFRDGCADSSRGESLLEPTVNRHREHSGRLTMVVVAGR
jgi:hypothetical protein